MADVHTREDLKMMQSLPLSVKVRMTEERIRGWVREYGEDGVYVSFSGGKDSTVLLHIARKLYPNIKAVFSNTSNEYPEVVKFVKTFDNVDIVTPKMGFRQVILKHGYPVISKEVSECVCNSRKFLDQILQADGGGYNKYRNFFDRIAGQGAYRRKIEQSAASSSIRDRQDTWDMREENARGDISLCGQIIDDAATIEGGGRA